MSNSNPNLTNRDYTLKIGQYFSRGWEIFKQYLWGFIGFGIVIAIISAIASKLPPPLGISEGGSGNLINGIISPILLAGFYIVAFKIAKNRPRNFSDFFRGFSKFLPIFFVNFVGNFLVAVGILLLVIPGIYLAVGYFFSIAFVIEKRFDFWTALETSRKLVTKKWFSFLGFALLLLLLNLGGFICLVVGLFVTIPWTFCIIVAAFEDIIGFNNIEVNLEQ